MAAGSALLDELELEMLLDDEDDDVEETELVSDTLSDSEPGAGGAGGAGAGGAGAGGSWFILGSW